MSCPLLIPIYLYQQRNPFRGNSKFFSIKYHFFHCDLYGAPIHSGIQCSIKRNFTPSSLHTYMYAHTILLTVVVHTLLLYKKKKSAPHTDIACLFWHTPNILYFIGSAQIAKKKFNFIFKNVYQTKLMFTL